MEMKVQIIVDDGSESVFYLTDDDVEVLKNAVATFKCTSSLKFKTDYNIATELSYGAHKWVEHLRGRGECN